MRLYHFTTEQNLEQILENGCINQSVEGVVWLTKNKELEAQEWADGNNPTVRISVSLLNISYFGRNAPPQKLVQGAADWYTTAHAIPQKLWVDVESLKKGHWCIYKGLSYRNRKK
ncbi:MAG: hypothetical protein H6Q71_1408 [Firmicutes bacterium]|jgi:hypothetical protein|nr:hypothetical protein [Bacillota bacterium]